MALSILNNIPSLVAENQLNIPRPTCRRHSTSWRLVRVSTAAPTMRPAFPSPIAYRRISPP